MNKEDFVKISRIKDNVTITLQITDGTTFLKHAPTNKLEQLALLLKIHETFGNVLKDKELLKMAQEWQNYKAKLETQKKLKEQKERELWLKERNDPFNRFCWILRNNLHTVSPYELDNWLNETTTEQRKTVYEKFKKMASARGLGLPKTTIEFGMSYLQSSLTLNENNQGEKKSWLQKIIGK